MKNLKKVLALVVALTMVLGTVSFAFTDVTEESDVYTAVSTLSSLEILKGYEDGTFGPEKDITRSEFAAVVCRALGMEKSANGAKGATQFADVPADHWASGYINLAAGQGIINGYPNGNFGPDDNVTYEQAVKMLVVALGFDPVALQKGGYPTGYLVVANQYGMTKDVAVASSTDAANRGVVAQLTFNALDIPVMEQTGFGTDVELTIQDGKNQRDYKTLLTNLDVEKLDGVIEANAIIGGLDADKIGYNITEVYSRTLPANFSTGYQEFTLAEGVVATDYFGIASTIYVQEVRSGKWEVIAIMAGETSEVITMTAGDVEFADVGELKYYESDTATKTTRIKLNGTPKVYLNNVTNSVANVTSFDDDAQLTIIENTGDSAFDMIIAKSYSYDLVEEVQADKDRIRLDGGVVKFDFEDETNIYTIVDKDGNAIELADFAEDDIVAYIEYTNGIEIINLGANVVEGTVTQKSSDDTKLYIDGVEYERTASFTDTVNVTDEGIFYLTAEGKIFNMDVDASVSDKYAYILQAGWNDVGFEEGWQLKLLTKDGKIATYNVKDSFKFNNTTVTSAANAPAEFQTIEGLGTAHKKNADTRLVTYKLDSNNEIREIKVVATEEIGEITEATATVVSKKEYKAAAQTIASKPLADGIVVFNIGNGDLEDATAADLSALVDETEYAGYVVANSDGEYNCFVVLAGDAAIDYTQDIAIVDSTSTGKNDLDEEVTNVTFYTSNDDTVKTLVIDDDTKYIENVENDGNGDSYMKKGTIFMYAADAEGNATYIAILATVESGKYVGQTAVLNEAVAQEEDNAFVTDGYINTMRSVSGGRAVKTVNATLVDDDPNTAATLGADDEIVIKGAANAYTIVNHTSTSANRIYISVADWQDDDVDVKDGTEAGKATFFFARLTNGVVTDIVTLGDVVAY